MRRLSHMNPFCFRSLGTVDSICKYPLHVYERTNEYLAPIMQIGQLLFVNLQQCKRDKTL